MKRIDVHSQFSLQWFNFDISDPPYNKYFTPTIPLYYAIREKYFGGIFNKSDITINAESITRSMLQERYVLRNTSAFDITARSQFAKIKPL